MNEMISSYIAQFSLPFFFYQLLVIAALFALGYLVNLALCAGRTGLFEVILAFPAGVSVYTLLSFVILMAGLPFNRIIISCLLVLVAAICVMAVIRYGDKAFLGTLSKREVLTCLTAVLCIAALSVSGLLAVSVSNDSLYYYSMYPRAIAGYGYFRAQFDVFLTDVGPASAIMNTLPFIYGFNESFGIQTFLGINTSVAVAYALYVQAGKRLDKKKAALVTGVLLLLLLSSQPYLIMLKWMMSNGCFMCFIFLTAYTLYHYEGILDETDERIRRGWLIIASMLFLHMSMLRMEGIMVALILLACFIPFKYKNRELLTAFAIPLGVCALVYSIRVFLILKVDAPYTFLTPKKALVQLAAIGLVMIYLFFVRGRKWDIAGKNIRIVLPGLLVLVNLALFVYDRSLYLANLKAFAGNISNRSGWGLFPMLILAAYILVFTVSFGKKKDKPFMTYWDMCFVSYLLAALAVCFAREGALRENIGDSGNRVLMQATILAFMAAAIHLIDLVEGGSDTFSPEPK
ncbi:MAG: hypothetical protein K5857_00420 [Lachnospiraceae bacterium]|nr:hypothetical protein [Lachnospiraceae bacterium]